MGQKFKMPQLGHQFSEGQLDLTDSIVLIVSHSGGTFSSLNAQPCSSIVSQGSLYFCGIQWELKSEQNIFVFLNLEQFKAI